MIDWLNYHHLFYFQVVVEEGSVSAAAKRLSLSQPTVSTQLKQLEESLEAKLFERRGRRLELTDAGELAFDYAKEIFSLGKELRTVFREGALGESTTLRVGVTESLPKTICCSVLLPVYEHLENVSLICKEGSTEDLLAKLASYELDLVISDAPHSSNSAVKAFNHLLGESKISLFAAPSLAKGVKGKGKAALKDLPFILPTRRSVVRAGMEEWFRSQEIEPIIVGEFDDSALLKTFGSQGVGIFPMASATKREIEKRYGVKELFELDSVIERFYGISLERRVTHPAVKVVTTHGIKALSGK